MAINQPEITPKEPMPVNTTVLMWQGLAENLEIMLNAIKADNIEELTVKSVKSWYIKGNDVDIEGGRSIPVYVDYLLSIMPDNLPDKDKAHVMELINEIKKEMERYTGYLPGVKNTWLYIGIVAIVIIVIYFKFYR